MLLHIDKNVPYNIKMAYNSLQLSIRKAEKTKFTTIQVTSQEIKSVVGIENRFFYPT